MADHNADEKTPAPSRLREAMQKARIEAADRTGVVVDLRDAELARLEILNEALTPLFAEIPDHVELFDRGISQGDVPRLWIDAISHIGMGRDKRTYRFVQDTRFGRTILAETHDVPTMVNAVTDYIARRMAEREQALVVPAVPAVQVVPRAMQTPRRTGAFWPFVMGVIVGAIALFGVALLASLRQL